MDLKQDLHCDTIETREEYEMKVRERPGSEMGGSAGEVRTAREEWSGGLQKEQKREWYW